MSLEIHTQNADIALGKAAVHQRVAIAPVDAAQIEDADDTCQAGNQHHDHKRHQQAGPYLQVFVHLKHILFAPPELHGVLRFYPAQ